MIVSYLTAVSFVKECQELKALHKPCCEGAISVDATRFCETPFRNLSIGFNPGIDKGGKIAVFESWNDNGGVHFHEGKSGYGYQTSVDFYNAVADGHVDSALVCNLQYFGNASAGSVYPVFDSWAMAMNTGNPFGPSGLRALSEIMDPAAEPELQADIDEIFTGDRALHTVYPCVSDVHESGGMWRENITSIDAFAGKMFRTRGVSAPMWAKVGVNAISEWEGAPLSGGAAFGLLLNGDIDGMEFSNAWFDEAIFQERLTNSTLHYYTNNFHQPRETYALIMKKTTWDSFDMTLQKLIKDRCTAATLESITKQLRDSFAAIRKMQQSPITVTSWSPSVIETLRTKWLEVAEERRVVDAKFDRTYTRQQQYMDEAAMLYAAAS